MSDASTVFGKMSDVSTTLGKLSDRSTPNVERRLMHLSQYGKTPDASKRWGQVGEERILVLSRLKDGLNEGVRLLCKRYERPVTYRSP